MLNSLMTGGLSSGNIDGRNLFNQVPSTDNLLLGIGAPQKINAMNVLGQGTFNAPQFSLINPIDMVPRQISQASQITNIFKGAMPMNSLAPNFTQTVNKPFRSSRVI